MAAAISSKNRKNQCDFDCIVVGAGGMGSAAAYHLAKDGHSVLLLEQFQIGHTRGSSHGGSRIIRYTHDTTAYAKRMPQTFALWRQLEQESGEHLLQMAGGLFMGLPEEPFLNDAQTALDELNFPFERLDSATLCRRFPQFNIPSDWIALYQEHTGMLAASRCVQTLARQAVRNGATVQEQTQVTAVRPIGAHRGGGVEIEAQGPAGRQTFTAAHAILCAGPWASRFLVQLLPHPIPLRVTHQQVVYYAAAEPVSDAGLYAPGRFPVFLCAAADFIYGLPSWEQPGLIKLALEQTERTVDPDEERAVDPQMLETLNTAVARYLPHISPQPVYTETCLYTETRSRDFIIDRHPEHPQIVLAAGFSGRGFKHAIAVGRLLADLAASAPGEYDSEFWLENYRLENFIHADHSPLHR